MSALTQDRAWTRLAGVAVFLSEIAQRVPDATPFEVLPEPVRRAVAELEAQLPAVLDAVGGSRQ